MAQVSGPNLGLIENADPGENWYNELIRFLRGVDLLVQARIKSMSTTAPPGSPANGDAYIIPSGATGAWAGKTNQIARWTTRPVTATWEYFVPKLGWQVHVDDVAATGAPRKFDGSAWVTGGDYVLPAATASTLGGVKQGSNVMIAGDGTLTVSAGAFEAAGAVAAHLIAADPHSQYALDSDLSTHAGAADPHTVYVLKTGADGTMTRQMLKDTGFVFYDSNTTNALDYTNGSCQRWAPATGAQTLSITNWPPSGNLGELLIQGVNLGAATITWPTINWVKSDGTMTTAFASNGVTLQASGTDFVFLWTRDSGSTVFGKVLR